MELSREINAGNTRLKSHIYTSYEDLIKLPDDLCYRTVITPSNGQHHHQITRPIVASINNLQPNGHMKNIIFTDEAPTSIELTNTELIYRYNDFFQITYVMTGKIVYYIQDYEITAEEGSILLIDDNTYYCENVIQSDGTIVNISVLPGIIGELLALQNSEDNLRGFLYRSFMKEKGKQNMLYFQPSKAEETAMIHNLVSDILFELKNKSFAYEHIAKGYVYRLLNYIAAKYQYSYTKEEHDSFRKYLFYEVKNFIFHHLADIQIQDLVDEFHYQRNYFNRLIREFVGLTYSEYLIETRITRAAHLLKTTDLNIDAIILSVGYNNKGFFYEHFNRTYGTTPAAYRRQNR